MYRGGREKRLILKDNFDHKKNKPDFFILLHHVLVLIFFSLELNIKCI
jgi:hypothetical protein